MDPVAISIIGMFLALVAAIALLQIFIVPKTKPSRTSLR
jgi:hypothetical protein